MFADRSIQYLLHCSLEFDVSCLCWIMHCSEVSLLKQFISVNGLSNVRSTRCLLTLLWAVVLRFQLTRHACWQKA